MFFACWWRRGQPLSPSLAAQITALSRGPGVVCAHGENTSLAARRPAWIAWEGPTATAHAVSPRSGARHPLVRLEDNVLTIAAGSLPEYPLYYAVAGDGSHLLACSQMTPLAGLFPTAALDAQRLVSLMAYGLDTDTDRTVYAGIRRLRPCEKIVARGDELRVKRDFPCVAGKYRKGNPEDLAAELRQRLEASVERAMAGAERVAVFVSGGLDSSGVLALAASRCRQNSSRTLDAISVQYAGPGDDRPHFVELTTALGLTPVQLRPQDAAPWFRQSLCMDAQPSTLSSTVLFLAQATIAVDRGIEAVLTGAGGDSVCGGLLPFARFAQFARQAHVWAALSGAMRLQLPWRVDPLERARYVLSPLVPNAIRKIKRRLVRGPRGPDWLTSRSRDLLARCREADEGAARPLPETPDMWMHFLCTRGQRTDVADTVGQLAALTGCFPVDVYLDEEFVHFMLELDPVMLSHGHQYRGLYRLAMKGILPERLRSRQDKASFETAVAAACGPDGVSMLRDLSSLEALCSRGLADPAPLRPTFEACFSMLRQGERTEPIPADERLAGVWQLLSAEAFLRECGRGRELV